MKRYWILLLLAIIVGVIAYNYSVFSFLLIAVISLSLVMLVLVGIMKVINKNSSRKWVRIPLAIATVGMIGVMVGLLRPLDPPAIESGDVSEVLAYAYEMDQHDRMSLKFYVLLNSMRKRDSVRLEQVKRLYEEQQVIKPLDKFHAAFIFHHGKKSRFYKVAHELASKAASAGALEGNYQVQWLAKATYGRWMLSIGKQQKYGTQDKFGISVN